MAFTLRFELIYKQYADRRNSHSANIQDFIATQRVFVVPFGHAYNLCPSFQLKADMAT